MAVIALLGGTGKTDDLADFILTQVEDRRFVGQLPFASN